MPLGCMLATMTSAPENDAAARARAAVEELAATNQPVTLRAVAAKAKVRAAVAGDEVRRWREQRDAAGEVPAVPDVFAGRIQALWADAVVAARGEHAQAKADFERRLREIEDDRDVLAEELKAREATIDQFKESLEGAVKHADFLRTTLEHRQAEVDRLRTELEEARAQAQEQALAATAANSRAENLDQMLARVTASLPGVMAKMAAESAGHGPDTASGSKSPDATGGPSHQR